VQNEFSLLYRTEAEETRRTTQALSISFVAYSPLGRGLLTAKIDAETTMPEGDARRRHPRFAAENISRNVGLVRSLEKLAQEKTCTIGQLALAWLLAQGNDVIAIPGTKRVERLQENLGALDVKLTPADLETIAKIIPAGAAAGLRYPEGQMKSVFV
jgi:aryl-alcohol dehydrogenase-like predicted oxidoreductase